MFNLLLCDFERWQHVINRSAQGSGYEVLNGSNTGSFGQLVRARCYRRAVAESPTVSLTTGRGHSTCVQFRLTTRCRPPRIRQPGLRKVRQRHRPGRRVRRCCTSWGWRSDETANSLSCPALRSAQRKDNRHRYRLRTAVMLRGLTGDGKKTASDTVTGCVGYRFRLFSVIFIFVQSSRSTVQLWSVLERPS